MTFVVKHRGDSTKPIVATYMCPEHGEFDAEVERDENGEAPDAIECGEEIAVGMTTHPLSGEPVIEYRQCMRRATWTPSPIACRVRRVEVTRGKWEKPERKTYLDTRKLGEGQSAEEFQAERRKMWAEKRWKESKGL
jgi:hypothetical protein